MKNIDDDDVCSLLLTEVVSGYEFIKMDLRHNAVRIWDVITKPVI